MLWALLARSLASVRGWLIGAAFLLCAFQVALVLQAASYDQDQTFESIGRLVPSFVQRWLGGDLAALASFGGIVSLGYFHPVVVLLMALVAAFVASDPAADVEGGHVDLLLSRPMARHWLVSRSAMLALACPLALAASMVASTLAATVAVGSTSTHGPSPSTIMTLAAHLVAVAWCFGALSLLVASGVRRRGTAFSAVAIAATGLYFIDVLAASWAPAAVADVLSPFHYYRGAEIVAGRSDAARNLLLLGSASVGLVGLSYWRFAVRDL